jgi:hypothetical protein
MNNIWIHVLENHLKKFKRLETDSYIEVEGKLMLNRNDYEHLVYVLNDVKLLKIIR